MFTRENLESIDSSKLKSDLISCRENLNINEIRELYNRILNNINWSGSSKDSILGAIELFYSEEYCKLVSFINDYISKIEYIENYQLLIKNNKDILSTINELKQKLQNTTMINTSDGSYQQIKENINDLLNQMKFNEEQMEKLYIEING